jgi:dihydrofolate reductase
MSIESKKPVHMIVACSENRVIGNQGTLPWRIKEDLQHLYRSVSGGVVIEGRKVWDELKKPYPDTQTIVLSRDPEKVFSGAYSATSLPAAIALANSFEGFPTIWIGGGQSLYEEAMAFADKLFLTLVHIKTDGDTFFPEWQSAFPHIVSERSSANKKYRYTFYELSR